MTWDITTSLRIVAYMRGVSARAWWRLCCPTVTQLTAKRRAKKARESGLLRQTRLGDRILYTVTDKAIRGPLINDVPRAWAAENQAIETYAFWRSELWVAFKTAGYSVSSGGAATYALRRSLLDALAKSDTADARRRAADLRSAEELRVTFAARCKCGRLARFEGETHCPDCDQLVTAKRAFPLDRPSVCPECSYIGVSTGEIHTASGRPCPGVAKTTPLGAGYDVAHRKGRAVALFIDSPYRAISTQLAAFPLALVGLQPQTDMMFVPTDGTYNTDELMLHSGSRAKIFRRSVLPRRTAAARARQGVLPSNVNLLPWFLVHLPNATMEHLSAPPTPEALGNALDAAMVADVQLPLAKVRGTTSPFIIAFTEEQRERLLRIRGRYAPNHSLRELIASLLCFSRKHRERSHHIEVAT